MSSSIGSISGQQFQAAVRSTTPQQVKTGRDSDGDNDNSKAGEVEKKARQPVSSTVGTRIDTTA
ncbi:hypothetical protein [Paludibacterium denitrificans]|uniref:Uncharacterized protein n=1 Tax=Paludibacterium denitrificans TaxID=2675226 RepID=A0A844GAK9_9NEIS|nr:hypothetical protein [Paludibacterium denitrificans]MTD32331.1 hypothetical protein [Paludibacterium denitrificans]